MKRGVAFALLVILALAGSGTRATGQTDSSGGSAADSTAGGNGAPADSAVVRALLSTDGAVTVFEEATPGEGIEGFWWEYDPTSDLTRLLDKDLRDDPLEPLTDAYGFDLVMPDSIRALRDSVTAVADSIRSATIELETSFDPKMKSRYTERKDDYELFNEFVSPIPLTRRTTLSTRVTDTQRYNQSTDKIREDRNLSSTFTFRYSEGVSTTLTANHSQSQQSRGTVLENDTGDTTVNGRAQARYQNGVLGNLDFSAGMALSTRDYKTPRTTGSSGSFRPDWGLKISRPLPRGNASLDYSGSISRGTREETRQENQLVDSVLVEVDVETNTNDSDRDDKLSLIGTYEVAEGWQLRSTSSAGRQRRQFIAQSDSIAGRQETRDATDGSTQLNLDAKPNSRLNIRASAGITGRKTEYDLETAKFAKTIRKDADTDIQYDAWTGAAFTIKLQRSAEDRNFLTAQSGNVDKQSASLDYKQKITQNVDLHGGYFLSLDSFAFDDVVQNTGDRDLLTERGTFTVRYNPYSILSTSIKMDVRETQSINIHPQKSGDNKTDFTYLITPSYTVRLGDGNINGEFTADSRYSVFDFDEERNSLSRRFGTRQRWQHAVSSRLSTELLGTFDFTDEGSFTRSEVDNIRRYSKSREIHRFRVEAVVQYSPTPWLRSRFVYRRDGDDNYSVSVDDGKSLTTSSRTDELTGGFTLKRRVLKTIQLDLDLSRTEKAGDRVTDVDRSFFVIKAVLEYQPFKAPKARQGGGNG
ncbi:MAG: hypothetical protein DHS20C21_10810 [Gemmatimonadota bacterium]|nr:MAG: hypothetical protein DHS20C21_10810 [Gemmatimonadota bacterium]